MTSVSALTDWCSQNGVLLDKRIEIKADDSGIAVYSREHVIPPLETLVWIPRIAVLSGRSCSISASLKPCLHGRVAQLNLALALYAEQTKGPFSRWYGYLQSLPNHADIPLLWMTETTDDDAIEAVRWLSGTEAAKLLAGTVNGLTLLEETRQFFHSTVVPVFASYFPSINPTFPEFCRAISLVASRAFLVDGYHGLSMVPVADAFNHIQDNHVHLESDFDVCPECGALNQCPHDSEAEPSTFEVSGRYDDYYEMATNSHILPFSQIYNTYGTNLSNTELLVRYGFTLEGNESDYLWFDLEDLESVCQPPPEPVFQQHLPLVKETSSSLICTDETPGHFRTLWYLDADGLVSGELWSFLVIGKIMEQEVAEEAVADKVKEVFRSQLRCESRIDNGESSEDQSPSGSDILSKVASSIISLCRERKIRVGQNSDNELGDILDALPLRMSRTRTALLQVMAERSLLESCESAWIDFLGVVSAP
ncbi:hypothetical protein C8J56DRAFT_804112 [Mycena floridula]|nr:hypothetical protein C8J56DRAFT_804112 [Mycena floridula]